MTISLLFTTPGTAQQDSIPPGGLLGQMSGQFFRVDDPARPRLGFVLTKAVHDATGNNFQYCDGQQDEVDLATLVRAKGSCGTTPRNDFFGEGWDGVIPLYDKSYDIVGIARAPESSADANPSLQVIWNSSMSDALVEAASDSPNATDLTQLSELIEFHSSAFSEGFTKSIMTDPNSENTIVDAVKTDRYYQVIEVNGAWAQIGSIEAGTAGMMLLDPKEVSPNGMAIDQRGCRFSLETTPEGTLEYAPLIGLDGNIVCGF